MFEVDTCPVVQQKLYILKSFFDQGPVHRGELVVSRRREESWVQLDSWLFQEVLQWGRISARGRPVKGCLPVLGLGIDVDFSFFH